MQNAIYDSPVSPVICCVPCGESLWPRNHSQVRNL